MDSEQRNLGNQNNLADSAQNELDLGLNKMEPITPKKAIGNEPSLLERAKTLFNKKPQTAVERKEPTLRDFSTAPNTSEEAFVPSTAQEEHHVAADPIVAEDMLSATTESTVTEENSVKTTASQAASAPKATKATKATLASPENWKILSILPQKHRRIFVALCILLLLLLFILLMKPSSETVQSFEQQNSNNIPIQFQQLDQTQENEATVLDAQTASSPSSLEITQPNITTNTNSEAAVAENKGVETNTPKAEVPVRTEAVKPHAAQHLAKKVETESVREEKAPAKPQPVVQNKPQVKPQAPKRVIEVVEAKSAVRPSAATAVTGKNLVVPQGVSLMQVFRDNNLQIADVNAMTKASGAGNVLSSFKPGDQVQVLLNAQGRVTELRLSNGGHFIRQADGSYTFKK